MLIRETELMHYGVLGMKWGHRKTSAYYQQQANNHIRKIKTSKTLIGKKYHNTKAYRNEAQRNYIDRYKNAKTLGSKLSEVLGTGRTIGQNRALSNYYHRAADYSKTKKKKQKNEAKAFNSNSMANTYEKIYKAKGIVNKMAISNAAAWTMPLKDLKGRETTYGREIIKKTLQTYAAGFALQTIAATAAKKNELIRH